MAYCRNCGKPVTEGAFFCKYCGMPVLRDMQGSGMQPQRADQAGSCAPPQNINVMPQGCGYAPSPQYVRCVRCGNILTAGIAYCNTCGAPVLEKDAYAWKASQGRAARDIQKKHGAAAFIVAWIQALALAAVLIMLFLILANGVFKDWLSHVDRIPDALCVFIPVMLLIFTLEWGVPRSKAIRTAGFYPAQYKRITTESNALPPTFFDTLPKEPQKAPEAGKDGKKKM